MATEILDLQSLSFGYPNTPIFENFSVSFRQGELVALLGANGAGKTTLLRLLNGLLRPQKGKVLLHGKPLPKNVSIAAQSVGIAFQNPTHQFFASTVQEELEYAMRWRKDRKQGTNERIQKIAIQFSLEDLLRRSPYSLSSGEQRRLSIATIVALGVQVIGLDEPTVGQDPKGRQMLADLLVKLKRSGIVIIAATHDLEWVIPLADRIVLLKRNEKPLEGLTSDILANLPVLRNAGLQVPQLVEIGNVLSLETLNGDLASLSDRTAHVLSTRLMQTFEKGSG
ncbi:MAG: energy-coupling factor ABC transporter ATP-binding protein [Candidatus Hodarchaeota archaeon]